MTNNTATIQSTTTQIQDTVSIVAHSLYDFCKDVEKAFKEGYVFDLEKSENAPIAYGHMMTCIMVNSAGKAIAKTKEIINTTLDTASAIIENASENINEVTDQITDAVTSATEAKPKKKK